MTDYTRFLSGTAVVLVGEAPGEVEEKHRKPFQGPSGNLLRSTFRPAGLRSSDLHITNVILCRPPGNKLSKLLLQITKANKEAEAKWKTTNKDRALDDLPPLLKPEPIKTPIECCAPRLAAELEPFINVITLGKVGTEAVIGSRGSVTALRGSLLELEATERFAHRKVVPTVHPAFVLRAMRWNHVFRSDVAKAARWFRGEADWVPPEVTYNPSAETLAAFLNTRRVLTFDLETDGRESLTANIRCVGVGHAEEVCVVGFLGKDGSSRFYPPKEEAAVRQILSDWFEDSSRPKSGWNSISYDELVLRMQWGVRVRGHIDGILLHKSVESELPHDLGYVASLYTDAPPWKTDREERKIATHAESDRQLHEYNAIDVAVTDRLIRPLADQVKLRDQVGVWQVDQRTQGVCCDMHIVGMYVDQAVRLAHERKRLKRRYELLNQIRHETGKPTLNPGSVQQLRSLLFEGGWGLEPPLEDKDLLTSSGDPSTADLVLRALLTDSSVKPEQREIIKLIRYYRKVQKVLGTYITKLRYSNVEVDEDLGWSDEDDDWDDKETRRLYGLKKTGIVDPRTGRMHPNYRAMAVTGRLASRKPMNAQNVPILMRDMVCAAPGHVLVGADSDQLELRIAASWWNIELYIRAFAEGKDPHSMTAFAVFGDAFCKSAGIDPRAFAAPGILVGGAYAPDGNFDKSFSDNAKKERDVAKQVLYSGQYMAGDEMAHEIIQRVELPALGPDGKEAEDGTTDLPYALLTLKKVRHMRQNWFKSVPEYKIGWEREIAEFRKQGFLREPISGRRRDFLDGEDPNALVNYKIQSAGASLINMALLQLHDQIPVHKWGPGTGIINQCHDSIVIECPADGVTFDAKGRAHGDSKSIPFQVAHMLEDAMCQTHPRLPNITFTAKAVIGQNWKTV